MMWILGLLASVGTLVAIPKWTKWYAKKQIQKTDAILKALHPDTSPEHVDELIEELEAVKRGMSE